MNAVTDGSSRAMTLAVMLALALSLAAPAEAGYENRAKPNFAIVAADLTVLRPLGLATLVVGSALFLVALPFAAGTGQVDAVADALVREPARFTFTRKFGDY